MKNWMNRLFAAPAQTPADSAEASQAKAKKQAAPDNLTVSGVAGMIADAQKEVEGSAIKAFLPIFLNRTHDLGDDVQVVAQRGGEVLNFLNPSVNMLGKLNNEHGYSIFVELDPVDRASALMFVTSHETYEQIELPAYPTLVINLGNGNVTLVYRLDTVIDRAEKPKEYRTRGILEEVMKDVLHADIQSHRILPFAGFFLRSTEKTTKNAVRLERYGKTHSLDALVDAFGARDEIEKRLKKVSSKPAVTQETGEVQTSRHEAIFNEAFSLLIANNPLSMYRATGAATQVARALANAGLDEQVRQALAPEFLTRCQNLEPEWTAQEGITEAQVTKIFVEATPMIPTQA